MAPQVFKVPNWNLKDWFPSLLRPKAKSLMVGASIPFSIESSEKPYPNLAQSQILASPTHHPTARLATAPRELAFTRHGQKLLSKTISYISRKLIN